MMCLKNMRDTFISFIVEPTVVDPCASSPCGPNARCNDGICTCLPEYQGDPYVGCRPECVLNTDCLQNRACIRNKCVDPCPGTCGINAECLIYSHVPMCSCPNGMVGNAFVQCNIVEGTIFFQPLIYLTRLLVIILHTEYLWVHSCIYLILTSILELIIEVYIDLLSLMYVYKTKKRRILDILWILINLLSNVKLFPKYFFAYLKFVRCMYIFILYDVSIHF